MGDGYVEVHNVAIRPGVLLVEFFGHIPAEYHILDTDYENYSSVYNCVNLPFNQKFEYAWVLGRRPDLEQEYVDQSIQAFADNGIDLSFFEETHQGDDCDYFVPPQF